MKGKQVKGWRGVGRAGDRVLWFTAQHEQMCRSRNMQRHWGLRGDWPAGVMQLRRKHELVRPFIGVL